MKFYLIFLNEGKVISIASFDNQESRDQSYSFWNSHINVDDCNYDNLQLFNEVD